MSSSAPSTVASGAAPGVDAHPSESYSLGRRVMILVAVVLGSTLYATTLLIASTLLPQMQGTMSATQDEIAARENPGTPGWTHAIADRPIRQVLTLMHGHLGHGWTLDELGQQVGLSRSALAERFRSAMGDTPLNHLRTLRMQKAMQLLADTRQTLEQVAQAVGYQDAFGFSKVFKRTTGQSPRQFREQDATDRQTEWRIQEAS